MVMFPATLEAVSWNNAEVTVHAEKTDIGESELVSTWLATNKDAPRSMPALLARKIFLLPTLSTKRAEERAIAKFHI